MRFEATEIAGVLLVEAEPNGDARGSFARLQCPEEFAAAALHDGLKYTDLLHRILMLGISRAGSAL